MPVTTCVAKPMARSIVLPLRWIKIAATAISVSAGKYCPAITLIYCAVPVAGRLLARVEMPIPRRCRSIALSLNGVRTANLTECGINRIAHRGFAQMGPLVDRWFSRLAAEE